jgi:hypothetical protein
MLYLNNCYTSTTCKWYSKTSYKTPEDEPTRPNWMNEISTQIILPIIEGIKKQRLQGPYFFFLSLSTTRTGLALIFSASCNSCSCSRFLLFKGLEASWATFPSAVPCLLSLATDVPGTSSFFAFPLSFPSLACLDSLDSCTQQATPLASQCTHKCEASIDNFRHPEHFCYKPLAFSPL